MTTQSPSKEQLIADIAHAEEKAATLCGPCADDHARLAYWLRALLAAYEQEPDYIRYSCGCCGYESLSPISVCPKCNFDNIEEVPLYTHPAPSILKLPPKLANNREDAHELNAGVDVWNKCIDTIIELNDRHDIKVSVPSPPTGLHPDTQKLVADFSAVLAEKLYKAQLKYGYSANWKNDDWHADCLAHFHQHIGKGDPRDVAAYCAFIWFHGWSTELPAPSIPAVPEEIPDSVYQVIYQECGGFIDCGANAQIIWNACRAAMLNGGKS
ncbi:hypothetical protein [Phytobacter ursingii]|uniref:Valyl-tRNA synthetase n=1 Tax=Phytobacter ursingii TaxID=1972431 RepID=A0AB35RK42_9ENTR|nr:hypothetical protein [Phytobacter ursingii]MDV2861824.1 hypothetical protein [Phytobacter ursingii]